MIINAEMFYWRSLKHSYIIHHHSLRKNSGTIRRSWPASPYCNIEDEKEIRIEWVIASRYIDGCDMDIFLVVDKYSYIVLFPYQTIHMKLLIKTSATKCVTVAL